MDRIRLKLFTEYGHILIVTLFVILSIFLVVFTSKSINMITGLTSLNSLLIEYSKTQSDTNLAVNRNDYTIESVKKGVSALVDSDIQESVVYEVFEPLGLHPNELDGLISVFSNYRNSEEIENLATNWGHYLSLETQEAGVYYNSSGHTLFLFSLLESNHTLIMKIRVRVLWKTIFLGICIVLAGIIFSVRGIKQISLLRKQQTELSDTIELKNKLLAEVHHRVKNNLAIISGMLQLEEMIEKDSYHRIKELSSQIKCMAIVQEAMYQSDTLMFINVENLIKNLVQHFERNIPSLKRIDVSFELINNQLNVNQASTLALICNVFMFFIDDLKKDEEASTSLKLEGDREFYTLIISDTGMPPIDPKAHYGEGTYVSSLLSALLSQLEAEYEVNEQEYFQIHLRFSCTNNQGTVSTLQE